MSDPNAIAGAPVRVCFGCNKPQASRGRGTSPQHYWCSDCMPRYYADRIYKRRLEKQAATPGIYTGGAFVVCWLSKQCFRCQAVKPLVEFRKESAKFDGRSTVCMECTSPKRPKPCNWRHMTPAQRVDARRDRKIRQKREARAMKAAAQGRTLGAPGSKRLDIENLYDRLIERNARDAWKHWIRIRAPDWWMRNYYTHMGKPWSNPRLTGAQQFKARYSMDQEFRAKEILKIQRRKLRRAEYIDANNDGTLTSESLCALFAAATECAYCKESMGSMDKSLDHVVALSRGGLHSIHNAAVCCKTCNTSKGSRTIEEWIASIFRRLGVGNSYGSFHRQPRSAPAARKVESDSTHSQAPVFSPCRAAAQLALL